MVLLSTDELSKGTNVDDLKRPTVSFYCLSFDILVFRTEWLKFGYLVKMHYYFIARCTIISQVAALLLLGVT